MISRVLASQKPRYPTSTKNSARSLGGETTRATVAEPDTVGVAVRSAPGGNGNREVADVAVVLVFEELL